MSSPTRWAVVGVFAGLILAACSEDPSSPQVGSEAPGIIEWVDAPQSLGTEGQAGSPLQEDQGPSTLEGRIEAPETVTAGEPFEVTFITIGANGCWEPAGTDLEVDGLTARATAYDRTEEEGQACTMVLLELPRTETLQFDEPGEGTIRLEGRRVEGDAAESDGGEATAQVEVTVTVKAAEEPAGFSYTFLP